MRLSPLALLLLLARGAAADPAPTVAAPAPDLRPVTDSGLYIGGGGGYSSAGHTAPAGPFLTGYLAVDRQLFWRLGIWLAGEWNYLFRDGGEADFSLRLALGPRLDILRTASRKVRLIGEVAFVHMHEAPVSIWKDHPLESLAGSSDHGLHHRFGAEVGLGLILTPWIDAKGWVARRSRILIRAAGQWLPDDHGRSFYFSATTALGLAI